MSNKKIEYYTVTCDALDTVINIQMLSRVEEQALFNNLLRKLKTNIGNFSIGSYKESFILRFVKDAPQFIAAAHKLEKDECNLYVSSLFNSILKVYPYLDLDTVCDNNNIEQYIKKNKKYLNHVQKQRIRANKVTTEKLAVDPETTLVLSSLEDLTNVEKQFKSEVLGQDEAIQTIVKSLKLLATDFMSHAAFFFVGQTGTGKTKLAQELGKVYSGHFLKINCAEYTAGHEYAKLIGAPPGYVGHSEESLLHEKAKISNQWVFLFDEFEKSHHKLHDFLLSLLDDGKCTDNLGRELDFSKSIFIFTSNQGVSDINYNSIGFLKKDISVTEIKETIIDSIKKKFSPEFINRIDNIVCFNPLTKQIVKDIVVKELEQLPIDITPEIIDYVVTGGYSQEYGARNIKRFIRDNISLLVADEILRKQVPKQKSQKYSLIFEDKNLKIVDTTLYKKKRVKNERTIKTKELSAEEPRTTEPT